MIRTGHAMSIQIVDNVSVTKERAGHCWDATCQCGWHYGTASRMAVGHAAYKHLEHIEQADFPLPHRTHWKYGS